MELIKLTVCRAGFGQVIVKFDFERLSGGFLESLDDSSLCIRTHGGRNGPLTPAFV